jgi:hypothetical protein
MIDLRKAAEIALQALEFSLPAIEDFGSKEQLTDCHRAIMALYKALAQLDSTSDSATRSADSAESFCKQELHNLMSVAGRMALELECLLLDTKDLSVVSEWWDTGMESLQAYRDYIWSITHGKEEIIALAQPEQEPVAWATFDGEGNYDFMSYENNETYRDEYIKRNGKKYANWVKPLYTAPPKREWVGLTDEERRHYNNRLSGSGVAEDIEAKLKEKNT